MRLFRPPVEPLAVLFSFVLKLASIYTPTAPAIISVSSKRVMPAGFENTVPASLARATMPAPP